MDFNSEQELYDYIGEFLIKQGKQSLGKDYTCLYRNEYGLKCAVGAVIPDEIYNKNFEFHLLHKLIVKFRDCLPQYIIKYIDLLYEMQKLHDSNFNWDENGLKIEKLIEFGKKFNLDTSKFDKLIQ